MKKFSRILAVCTFSILFFSKNIFAVESIRFVPLQERAQGQSLTGAGLMNDSLFSNPASSAFSNVYSLDATYLSPKNFSASVLDTRTSSISGALGFSRQPIGNTDAVAQIGYAAMTGKLLPYLGVGIGGHMAWAPNESGAPSRHTDMDVGMILSMDPVQVGISTRNLLGGDRLMGDFQQTSIGARIHYDNLIYLSAAAQSAPNTMTPEQYGIGAEYVSPYQFALKGGFRIRPREDRSYWSAGFSVLSPKVCLHYAVVFPKMDDESIQHVAGMTVLF